MSHNIGCDRRHLLGTALAAIGVPELVANRSDSWPERCTGIVAVSGYLIANRERNRQPLTPHAEVPISARDGCAVMHPGTTDV